MHKVSFFPIENADCCRITLDNGSRLLFDYCHRKRAGDTTDKKIDLMATLKNDLMPTGKLEYEVVCFTHVDSDHVDGASDFFWFDQAAMYQGDNRVKMKDMWVPAAALLEPNLNSCARVIRQEARHRLRKKSGVKIFSRPNALNKWLEDEKITLSEEERARLIVDAGKYVPGWSKMTQGVEFFVHCPFAKHAESGVIIDRNNGIYLQATFREGFRDTRLILSADLPSDVLDEIVKISRYKGNADRLGWDINNIPHHSSKNSLNNAQERTEVLVPPENVKWLYDQGGSRGVLVSTSKPIPNDTNEPQPPHKNAADYYEDKAAAVSGEYVVTMEFPTEAKPEEMVFEITSLGHKLKKSSSSTGSGGVTGTGAPRAGVSR